MAGMAEIYCYPLTKVGRIYPKSLTDELSTHTLSVAVPFIPLMTQIEPPSTDSQVTLRLMAEPYELTFHADSAHAADFHLAKGQPEILPRRYLKSLISVISELAFAARVHRDRTAPVSMLAEHFNAPMLSRWRTIFSAFRPDAIYVSFSAKCEHLSYPFS